MIGRKLPSRSAALSLLACVGGSSVALSAYVAVWKWTAPGYYLFLILGTYALFGVLTVFQVMRAVRTDDWTRKVGAVGVVVGLTAAVFLGLRPRTGCLDTGPCESGLTLAPIQLLLGIALAASSLFLDVRGRGRPSLFASE